MPRKIITVTLHTSVDVLIEVESLGENTVIDALSSSEVPAGKGVNVARALSALGDPVLAFGIVGKGSAEIFARLSAHRISTDFIPTPGESRRNLTIIRRSTGAVTHIRTKGYRVRPALLIQLRRRLERRVGKDDIILFSGSLPPGAGEGWYHTLLNMCTSAGAFVAIDSYGAPLRRALRARPHLVKMNRDELIATFGLPADASDRAIATSMHALASDFGTLVVLTRGVRGVLVANKNDTVAMEGDLDLGGSYSVRQSVGAGDALFAGFVHAIRRKLPLEDAIRWGVACGAANVLSSQPGGIDIGKVRSLLPKVRTGKVVL